MTPETPELYWVEAEWLEAWGRGDEDVMGRMLMRLAQGVVDGEGKGRVRIDAEEAVSHVAMKCWAARGRWSPERAPAFTFFTMVAISKLKSFASAEAGRYRREQKAKYGLAQLMSENSPEASEAFNRMKEKHDEDRDRDPQQH